MEDIFSVVIVLLIYAAFIGSVRKSARRRNGKKRAARREPGFETAFDTGSGKAPGAGRITLEEAREAFAREPEPGCQTSRLHLHEVTQEEMSAAGEGEDPCHGGHAPQSAPVEEPETGLFSAPPSGEETDALGQDILRGVIMSEILTRPCERRKRSSYGR